MRHAEMIDKAHEHMAMMGGMTVEDKLKLIRLIERMITQDWESVVARPILSVVAGS